MSACRLGLGMYNGFITMGDFPVKRLLCQIAQWHALCATCLLVGLLVCSHLRFIKLYIVVLTNILNYAKRTFWETILFRRIPLFRERMQILKVTYMENKFSFSKAVLEWICLCNGNGKKWDFSSWLLLMQTISVQFDDINDKISREFLIFCMEHRTALP